MGFEPPPGNPDAITSSLATLARMTVDLKTAQSTAKSGFAAALQSWHGPRADDFRPASGGIQLQMALAQNTLDDGITDLRGYALRLAEAIATVKHLQSLALARQRSVADMMRSQPPDSSQIDMAEQHCAQFVAGLEVQAEQERAAVRRAASAVAGLLDAGTAVAVPGGPTLTPSEIARRVTQSSGTAGIVAAVNGGHLTAEQARSSLDGPKQALPPEDIAPDGSVQWDKVAEQVKESEGDPLKKGIDTSLDLWTVGTAPSAGWALARLAVAAHNFAEAKSALPVDVFKLSGKALDTPGVAQSVDEVLNGVEGGMRFGAEDVNAVYAAGDLSAASDSLVRSGLPEALDGTLGKVFIGLGFFADAWTLVDPHSAKDDKVEAGLNAAGLALTTETGAGLVAGGIEATGLLAADAAIGWVPVVGWGLVAVTAGYEAWKHRKELGHLAEQTWHGIEWLGDKQVQAETWVAHEVWNGAENVASGVADVATNVVDGVADVAGDVGDGLSSAAHAATGFISSHVPHVHLW